MGGGGQCVCGGGQESHMPHGGGGLKCDVSGETSLIRPESMSKNECVSWYYNAPTPARPREKG